MLQLDQTRNHMTRDQILGVQKAPTPLAPAQSAQITLPDGDQVETSTIQRVRTMPGAIVALELTNGLELEVEGFESWNHAHAWAQKVLAEVKAGGETPA